jgi:hypothetical protein
MCNNNDIEDEYHFILECSKYVEIRRKYIKTYYCINPSVLKLTRLLSVQNIKELNNLGKYLYVAEKIRNYRGQRTQLSNHCPGLHSHE